MFKTSSLYQLPNGMSVHYLSKTDTFFVYKDIFERDIYRQYGITICDGDYIFDIGANTGLFALFVNQVCHGATLYAFEPIPAIFAVLSRNLEQCRNIRVKSFNLGLSRSNSTATFTFFPRSSCSSTMYYEVSEEEEQQAIAFIFEQFRLLPNRPLRRLLSISPSFVQNGIASIIHRYLSKRESVTCRLETVSDLIEQQQVKRIDLLKIDAERSEMDILAGIREEDWPKIRQAVVEVHGGPIGEKAVREQLKQHGFQVASEPIPHFSHIIMLYAIRAADRENVIHCE